MFQSTKILYVNKKGRLANYLLVHLRGFKEPDKINNAEHVLKYVNHYALKTKIKEKVDIYKVISNKGNTNNPIKKANGKILGYVYDTLIGNEGNSDEVIEGVKQLSMLDKESTERTMKNTSKGYYRNIHTGILLKYDEDDEEVNEEDDE